MGARAYGLIQRYAKQLDGAIVEIGSERGEGSTSFLAAFAHKHNLPFYTVDTVLETWLKAREIAGEDAAILDSGEHFLLETFPTTGHKIAFAYLDGFDWTPAGLEDANWIVWQRDLYKARMGVEMNNRNSQASHLAQAKLIQYLAAPTCLVLLDDTWRTDTRGKRTWDGKGGTAVPYLMHCRFKLLERGDQYALLGRGVS